MDKFILLTDFGVGGKVLINRNHIIGAEWTDDGTVVSCSGPSLVVFRVEEKPEEIFDLIVG